MRESQPKPRVPRLLGGRCCIHLLKWPRSETSTFPTYGYADIVEGVSAEQFQNESTHNRYALS